jgi:transposase InsO family protein
VAREVVELIVAMRTKHPTWGPKKLEVNLAREHPEVRLPSRSTMAEILKRSGLIQERRPRRRTPQSSFPLAAATAPNVVWCTDFKGKFRVDRRYCHPLTITDAHSRFIFRCEPLDGERTEFCQQVFEAAFREYGMPLRMRSDNGSPFASSAVGGLSALSVWWIKLGILPERIEVGHPEQNGRHERMHRTLKAETASPPASDWETQRLALERWRQDFNDVRPHEALGQKTPASCHQLSPRKYEGPPGDPEYPSHFEVRRVKSSGVLGLRQQQVSLSNVLARECVGLEPLEDGLWHLWFGPIFLGKLRELGRKGHHFEKSRPIGRNQ